MGETLLFVYGTLLRDAGHAMHRVLARDAARIGRGAFRGRLYRVSHYPGAVPSDDPADSVQGEVYRLRDPGQTLAALDAYEDAAFERCEADITLVSGEIARAWIYLYREPTESLARIASGDFSRSA